MNLLIATLASQMRELRRQRGMSQVEFAELLEMNYRYYGRIERGEQNITLETLGQIAERLEMDPLNLLGGSSSPR